MSQTTKVKTAPTPLKKIRELTTDIGIYQHGKLDRPDPKFGFALEDQARALIIANDLKAEDLKKIYLDFIIRAKSKESFFYQYFYEDGRGFVKDITPSTVLDRQEAYGITLWALFSTNNYQDGKMKLPVPLCPVPSGTGLCVTEYLLRLLRRGAKSAEAERSSHSSTATSRGFLRRRIKATVCQLKKNAQFWIYPRAIAAALLGLSSLPFQDPLEAELTEKMLGFYKKTAVQNWPWFENYLTYANAVLPWACWEISLSRKDKEMEKIADITTKFLIETCQTNGIPSPIGNKGWYPKGGQKTLYDQQPIDSAYMVCCLEKAYLSTKKSFYLEWAKKWWGWFWGNNLLKTPLVDENFACYDALTPTGVNLNQGAESNICFIMAYLAAKRLKIV